MSSPAAVDGTRSTHQDKEGTAAAVKISLEGAYFYKGQFPALKIRIDREGHATNTLNVRFPEVIQATDIATGKRLKFYQDNRSAELDRGSRDGVLAVPGHGQTRGPDDGAIPEDDQLFRRRQLCARHPMPGRGPLPIARLGDDLGWADRGVCTSQAGSDRSHRRAVGRARRPHSR